MDDREIADLHVLILIIRKTNKTFLFLFLSELRDVLAYS